MTVDIKTLILQAEYVRQLYFEAFARADTDSQEWNAYFRHLDNLAGFLWGIEYDARVRERVATASPGIDPRIVCYIGTIPDEDAEMNLHGPLAAAFLRDGATHALSAEKARFYAHLLSDALDAIEDLTGEEDARRNDLSGIVCMMESLCAELQRAPRVAIYRAVYPINSTPVREDASHA